jgi:two-component system NtrC family sensor kinase
MRQQSMSKTGKNSSSAGGYSGLIISIALFLILDLLTLVYNFSTSGKGEQDLKSLRLVTLQQIRLQQIFRSIYQAQIEALAGRSITDVQKDLLTSCTAFETTLKGFSSGQMVPVAGSEEIYLPPIESESAQATVVKATEYWLPCRRNANVIINAKDSLPPEKIAAVIKYATENNPKVIKLMSDLANELESTIQARTQFLRTLQLTVIIIGVASFFFLIFGFIRDLRRRDEALAESSEQLEALVQSRTKELRASEVKLIQLNTGLEQMVSERTKELRASQAQLVQSEKMASLGQMVAGLAHEINTPLGYVRNNVVLLNKMQDDMRQLIDQFNAVQQKIIQGDFTNLESMILENERTIAALERRMAYRQAGDFFNGSLEGLDRIQDLIVDLRNFSRLDEAKMKDTDINQALDSTLKIANNILKHRVTVTKKYGNLPMVRCYPAQINQVFLNLVTNAAQACEKPDVPNYKGELTLETHADNEKVFIEISDNGTGIAEKNLSKIFEPFFTTKPVGKGTGLGLSIVYKIIEQHNGKITVSSTVGVGTTFTVMLPVVAQNKSGVSIFEDEAESQVQTT